MLSKIVERLKTVIDPEIGLNLVDLGMIYGIKQEGQKVEIQMSLTSPHCPMGEVLIRGVESALQGIGGNRELRVLIIWNPPWDPSMISEEGKRRLGAVV